jgi:hypothetical protein
MHRYWAFGLRIASELLLPELLEDENSDLTLPDIEIKYGPVSPDGLGPQFKKQYFQAQENILWLDIYEIARFLISNGNTILIDPFPGIDEASIRAFLLGSAMGALLIQRNVFLLHGNAIKVGDSCVTFVGDSGAGKSTLSAAFFKRGYSILADDVCAINTQNQVMPSYPQIKLCPDAADNLGISNLKKVSPKIEKLVVPLGKQFYKEFLPINAIYLLQIQENNTFYFEPVLGMEKLKMLFSNIYRFIFLAGLKKDKFFLKQSMHLAKNLNLVKVRRPGQGFQLDKLVDMIEHNLFIKEKNG